jgi:hypothetical protein
MNYLVSLAQIMLLSGGTPLDPQPVGLEENGFISVAEELLDGARRRSAPLIWFDTFDEEQEEWRDMNAEIRKLSSLSALNSVPCPAKLSSRSVPVRLVIMFGAVHIRHVTIR